MLIPTRLLLLANTPAASNTLEYPLNLVNPLIGTAGGGHVFPGASLPFGMVKAGADTNGDNMGGFDSLADLILGFSHMHDSGTGGSPSLGNFPIFPHAGCVDDDTKKCPFAFRDRAIGWVKQSVKASPGYFSLLLNSSILAEVTVSNHSALYRFTFPDNPAPPIPPAPTAMNPEATRPQNSSSPSRNGTIPLSPLIIVELQDLSGSGWDTKASVDPDTGRLQGNGTFRPSFGTGGYSMHFCVDFQGGKVRETGTDADEWPWFAYTRFHAPEDNKILARVGISFISVDQACENAEKEIPNFDFDSTVSTAADAWKQKFRPISIDAGGASQDIEVIFWSGIYRTMISPQDYSGENPHWNSTEPYYDSFYCIWDSFRTLHPFLTLIDPESQSRMVRSLVDIYQHTGYLPDCRMSLCKGNTQGGSNADVVIAESYLKGIQGVDWETAYQAVVKDAEIQPDNWNHEGRGGLDSWKNLNYLAQDDCKGSGLCTRSISRTVEYAYDDFCIAQMAKNMNRTDDYTKYTARSGNWLNLLRLDQNSTINGTDTGFTGYLQPRFLNGTWGYQDPILCSPLLHPDWCFLSSNGHETYEGSCWLYTFFVPHDMAKLITNLGGPERFIKRLTYFHQSGLLDMGNEQAFLTVYQFHYGGRPGLSARQAHVYIPSIFNKSVGGLPGNDDSGAMGAFLAFAVMGLYPVHGQDVYLITPPFFKEAKIRHPSTGKTAIIRNVNFDPSYKAIYIQSATRDGKAWTKNWIQHDFFTEGGVLELVLGEKESKWGTEESDLPPSISTNGFQ
ncbi:hypothetical protein FQN57_002480 [Myotisia sp. PD_48]|nr:hypothetical protein FQN57_002480 [Myotisia sp. PD_48]